MAGNLPTQMPLASSIFGYRDADRKTDVMIRHRFRRPALASSFFSTSRPRAAVAEWLVIPQAGQKLELAGRALLQRMQFFDFGILFLVRMFWS